MKRPRDFDTHYPTKKELDWYVENNLFGDLDERMCDMTSKNIVLDGMKRRNQTLEQYQKGKLAKAQWETIPLDVLALVSIRMDIRDVLKNACKTVVFAHIISQDKFWK